MATYSIDEALSRLSGYLDRVAGEAEGFMKAYIDGNANQGYATGALSSSINVRKISENARGVGTSLKSKSGHVYGEYVDKGRGPVTAKNPSGRLHYYDPVVGKWMHPRSVGPMRGIHFIAATKNYLESTHIPL